jgi:ATP-dependent DNA helicase RecG
MLHPEFKVTSLGQKPLFEKTFAPVYHTTQGIYQSSLRQWINLVFDELHQTPLSDPISKLQKQSWDINSSLKFLHHPDKDCDLSLIENFTHPAQQTLILEEFCANRLSLLNLKKQRKKAIAIAFTKSTHFSQALLKQLPFELTKAQTKVIGEISEDLTQESPMLRLLQGDVGSGKTIVAILSALQVISHNYQVAIMAPTEILAKQHFFSFSQILKKLNIELAYLTGKQKTVDKRDNLEKIKSGKAQIIIGTHALFQDSVAFDKLGLVIIDEQHRFGVHQRLKLSQKATQTPHQLVMTATPIPRSLAMSAYADLDTSIIDELPKGRKPIKTVVMSLDKKQEVMDKISLICEQKQQVYWVSTLIEESEALQLENTNQTFSQLSQNLPNYNIAIIHGRMKEAEKLKTMTDFANQKIDILIATTVIEVGVNVPNASLMVIENAERLGLAQLHQLRGRVGRGNIQSICILLYLPPLSQNAKTRLNILRETNDGFLIAQKDLEIRGPGEVLGTQQTGLQQLKIADINRDGYLLQQTQELTQKILSLTLEEQNLIIKRWVSYQNFAFGNT